MVEGGGEEREEEEEEEEEQEDDDEDILHALEQMETDNNTEDRRAGVLGAIMAYAQHSQQFPHRVVHMCSHAHMSNSRGAVFLTVGPVSVPNGGYPRAVSVPVITDDDIGKREWR